MLPFMVNKDVYKVIANFLRSVSVRIDLVIEMNLVYHFFFQKHGVYSHDSLQSAGVA